MVALPKKKCRMIWSSESPSNRKRLAPRLSWFRRMRVAREERSVSFFSERCDPLANLRRDLVPDFAHGFQFFLGRTLHFRRVGKAPLEPLRDTSKDRAFFGRL